MEKQARPKTDDTTKITTQTPTKPDAVRGNRVVSLLADFQIPDDMNPAALYIHRQSDGSRPSIASTVRRLANALVGRDDYRKVVWPNLKYRHVVEAVRELGDRYSPSSINSTLNVAKGIIGEAWALGLVDLETRVRVNDIKAITYTQVPAGRSLSNAEIRSLFSAARQMIQPERTEAILALGLGAGLRRMEIVNLKNQDYDRDSRILTVRGKGNKERKVPMATKSAAFVDRWVQGKFPDNWMFPSPNDFKKHLNPYTIHQNIGKAAEIAGVWKVTAHDLRRTYATNLLSAGVDLLQVQRLMGHTSSTNTAIYDRRPLDELAEAVEVRDLPL